jgi:hypothetical protein
VRTARERYAPVRHRAFRIKFGGLLKRTDRRAMIKSVNKGEALIEIALCFGRFGRDLARIGAEPIVERFLRCI